MSTLMISRLALIGVLLILITVVWQGHTSSALSSAPAFLAGSPPSPPMKATSTAGCRCTCGHGAPLPNADDRQLALLGVWSGRLASSDRNMTFGQLEFAGLCAAFRGAAISRVIWSWIASLGVV
jgi:hypothetical protein